MSLITGHGADFAIARHLFESIKRNDRIQVLLPGRAIVFDGDVRHDQIALVRVDCAIVAGEPRKRLEPRFETAALETIEIRRSLAGTGGVQYVSLTGGIVRFEMKLRPTAGISGIKTMAAVFPSAGKLLQKLA